MWTLGSYEMMMPAWAFCSISINSTVLAGSPSANLVAMMSRMWSVDTLVMLRRSRCRCTWSSWADISRVHPPPPRARMMGGGAAHLAVLLVPGGVELGDLAGIVHLEHCAEGFCRQRPGLGWSAAAPGRRRAGALRAAATAAYLFLDARRDRLAASVGVILVAQAEELFGKLLHGLRAKRIRPRSTQRGRRWLPRPILGLRVEAAGSGWWARASWVSSRRVSGGLLE